MALADIVRGQIANLSNIVQSFKGTTQYSAWVGQNGAGGDEYATAIPVEAIISLKKEQRFTPSGAPVMTVATLLILDPMADTAPNTGQTRQQPVDPRDVFVLPDGSTAPIIESSGLMDPATSRGFTGKVVLGVVIRGQ